MSLEKEVSGLHWPYLHKEVSNHHTQFTHEGLEENRGEEERKVSTTINDTHTVFT